MNNEKDEYLQSPSRVKGRRRIFGKNSNKILKNSDTGAGDTGRMAMAMRLRSSNKSLMDDGDDDIENVTHIHHIIKVKPNKNDGSIDTAKKESAMKKARRTIQKRMTKLSRRSSKNMKNKPQSCSYASASQGIEASFKLTRSQTFMNKMKDISENSVHKLKSASDAALDRGRSLERSLSAASVSLRRSLSKRRDNNKDRSRSISRGDNNLDSASVASTKSRKMLQRVRSFRRQRSLSVRSVRSTKSNFSVKSQRSHIGGLFNKIFRRKPQYDDVPTGTKILFVKEDQPHTAPSTPQDDDVSPSGFFMCNAFDAGFCRDLFCRPEEVEEVDKTVRYDDDPRYFGGDSDEPSEEPSTGSSAMNNNTNYASHSASTQFSI